MSIGITAGFGGLLGVDTLSALKSRGWQSVRNGDDKTADASVLFAIADEIHQAGLLPCLGIVCAPQVDIIPAGVLVEMDAQQYLNGEEPWYRNEDPVAYAATLTSIVPKLKAKGVIAYAMAGFTSHDGSLDWTKKMLPGLDPYYGLSVHRYPANSFDFNSSNDGGRAIEMSNWHGVIGNRQWIVGECGWDQGQRKHWYNFFSHSHLSDADQASFITQEFRYWYAGGAQHVYLFQFNDTPGRCPQHPQYAKSGGVGIRRDDQSWKPSATVSQEFMNPLIIASDAGECDRLPTGEYVVGGSTPSTHLGPLPLPPAEPHTIRFPRCTNNFRNIKGEFAVICTGQTTVQPTHIWTPVDGWMDAPTLPVGTSPVIFDNNGSAVINTGQYGAQGIAYVRPDNGIVSVDQTTGVNDFQGMAEWIDLSLAQDKSLVIGWAVWALALVVWDGQHHRLVRAGNAKFKNAHRVGNDITITVRGGSNEAWMLTTTDAALRAMEVFDPPVPNPNPPDPNPPKPDPNPPQPQPGVKMKYVDTTRPNDPQQTGAGPGTLITVSGGVALKMADGTFFSYDSGGNVSYKAAVGPDETFLLTQDGKALISLNDFQATPHRVRILPLVDA